MTAPCADLPIDAGWRGDAFNDRDRRVRAAQAAGLADGPRQLTLVICAFLVQNLAIEAVSSTRLLIELLATPTATGAAMAIGLLVLPRLSLVTPAMALGERLSLRHAWRVTRGNTLRLGVATALCMLPAVTLAMLVQLLMLLVRAPWWLDFSWPQIVALMWPGCPSGSSPSFSLSPLHTPFSSRSPIRSSPSSVSRCCR